MKRKIIFGTIIIFIAGTSLITPMPPASFPRTDSLLVQLLHSPGMDSFRQIIDHPDKYKLQIMYVQINRDKNNQPHFSKYYFNVDPQKYFYPASTVKMPITLCALEKLNTLKIPGLTRNTPMYTDSIYPGTPAVTEDTTAQNGQPSIAQYIRRIFLISDNDAANRLYEWVGQKELNDKIHAKGYLHTDILQRLNLSLSEDQNRHTNPVTFKKDGEIIYSQPEKYNDNPYPVRHDSVGKGYYENDKLIMHAKDFSGKNRFPLEDMQQILQSIIFPNSVPVKQRFKITAADRKLLLQYMSEFPGESHYPKYDTAMYYDAFGKFLWWGNPKHIPPHIRIFNKPGWAYGFLDDASYIVDFNKRVEFMLVATIQVNEDGILDDAHYQTEELGKPFLHHLGKLIYDYECNRPKQYLPDLSAIKLQYN